MQTTAEFASNSTANIKLSKHPSFLLVTSNTFITKSKKVATKKLCGGVVALKISRKLTCDGSLQDSLVTERFTGKVEREQCCKSQLIKVTN